MNKTLLTFCIAISFSFLSFCAAVAQTPEQNLKKLGITLSKSSPPVANYVNCVRVGNLLYLSGKGPMKSDGTNITGKLGKDLTIEQGYEAAKLAAIGHLGV